MNGPDAPSPRRPPRAPSVVPTLAAMTSTTASSRRGVASWPRISHPASVANSRLEAQQYAEHPLRQAPERRELEAVRDDRCEHRGDRCEQEQLQVGGHHRHGRNTDWEQQHGRHDEPHRQSAVAGDERADARAQPDVHHPEAGRDEDEDDAERVERFRADESVDPQQHHAEERDPHPGGIRESPGQHGGEHERPEELDRDRWTQGMRSIAA